MVYQLLPEQIELLRALCWKGYTRIEIYEMVRFGKSTISKYCKEIPNLGIRREKLSKLINTNFKGTFSEFVKLTGFSYGKAVEYKHGFAFPSDEKDLRKIYAVLNVENEFQTKKDLLEKVELS